MSINTTQVAASVNDLNDFPTNCSGGLLTFPLPNKNICTLLWCQVGNQPHTFVGSRHSSLSLFCSPTRAAWNKSKRRSRPCESNLFSGCCRDAVSHSQMKSDSEIRAQRMALLSVSNVYNDRNGNDGAFFFSHLRLWIRPCKRKEKLRLENYKWCILISMRIECHSQRISHFLL